MDSDDYVADQAQTEMALSDLREGLAVVEVASAERSRSAERLSVAALVMAGVGILMGGAAIALFLSKAFQPTVLIQTNDKEI